MVERLAGVAAFRARAAQVKRRAQNATQHSRQYSGVGLTQTEAERCTVSLGHVLKKGVPFFRTDMIQLVEFELFPAHLARRTARDQNETRPTGGFLDHFCRYFPRRRQARAAAARRRGKASEQIRDAFLDALISLRQTARRAEELHGSRNAEAARRSEAAERPRLAHAPPARQRNSHGRKRPPGRGRPFGASHRPDGCREPRREKARR